jgi:hypothetical protein
MMLPSMGYVQHNTSRKTLAITELWRVASITLAESMILLRRVAKAAGICIGDVLSFNEVSASSSAPVLELEDINGAADFDD